MSSVIDADGNGYFRQIIRDAVRDLERTSHAYCFTQEQVDLVMKQYDTGVLSVRENDGIFYINKVKFDKKKKGKKKCKEAEL